jgi:hypothetical protein
VVQSHRDRLEGPRRRRSIDVRRNAGARKRAAGIRCAQPGSSANARAAASWSTRLPAMGPARQVTRAFVLACVGVAAIGLLALEAVPAGGARSVPTFGKPPITGLWNLSQPASRFILRKHGSGFIAQKFRLRLGAECERFPNALVKAVGDLRIKRIVRRRTSETEIYYGIEGLKGYGRTSHGNTLVTINGESLTVDGKPLTANVGLRFARGLPGIHQRPVEGVVNLSAAGEVCNSGFGGHPAR